MFDIKITGGELFDGSGSPPVAADVGIGGDRIQAVGDLASAEAREVVEASGLCVCPGFIDVHSHSDTYLLIEPSAPSKVFQGITTEIVGQCGASGAPIMGSYRLPADWREKEYPGDWKTVAEYRELLEKQNPAPNVCMLIGHNTLRAGVMGYEPRPATPAELDSMRRALDQGLSEGARGFSTGLLYQPGQHARREEIRELARVVAERGGVYSSHMRSEAAGLLDAVDEVLDVARTSGVRVEISHLKTAGQKNWHLLDEALARIERARAEGLDVAADRYPYTAGSTELDIILPDWASVGGPDAVLARLRDPAARARIRDELAGAHADDAWRQILVGTTYHPDNRRFPGMSVAEVASELKVPPAEAVLRLIEHDTLKTGAIFFGMSEENMWKILARPYVMVGTDASLRAPTGPLSQDHPHPRAYGAFPKLLRAALDGKTVHLSEMVRKMTSLPAEHFGLRGRGVLEPGAKADVVVFNPKTVRDKATFAAPHQLSEGVAALLVNGVATIRDGRLTGKRGGRFLG